MWHSKGTKEQIRATYITSRTVVSEKKIVQGVSVEWDQPGPRGDAVEATPETEAWS